MAIAAAYPGVKAVFKDRDAVLPDITFDVVLWKEAGGEEIGLFVVPGSTDLQHPGSAPVPPQFVFSGYAYCKD